ncbi:MAG: Holliday junction resolvase RuvX [Thermaurantimonas sp.]
MDAGLKRCGIAETDMLQIIASPRETVETALIEKYLTTVLSAEPIEAVVLGYPRNNLGGLNEDVENIYQKIIKLVGEKFPNVLIHRVDERFTSKMAQKTLIEAGLKKKDRQKKENLDQVSAAIILKDYLESLGR